MYGFSSDAFKSKALSAFRWSAAAKLAVQLLQWMMTVVVVRLLAPGDYGLMAIATLFTGFLTLLNEMGLASAIVQMRGVPEQILRQVSGCILLINAGYFVVLSTASPFISSYFGEPRLALIVCALSIQFVLIAPSVVPRALLVRELEFRKIAFVEIFSRLAAGLATIVVALMGHGVWALVGGALVGTVVESMGFVVTCRRWHWPILSFDGLRPLFTFGGIVTLQRVLWFLYSQADILVIGKRLGRTSLGFFSVSLHVASLPMQKLNAVLNQLTLPVFSRLTDDGAPLGFYALKTVRLLSLFAFPVFFGISAVAHEAVLTVLGPQWLESSRPLALLALVMPLRMLNSPISEILNAIGRPKLLLSNVMLLITLVVPTILLGSFWGLMGVCWAWVIVFPVAFGITTARTARALRISFVDVLVAMSKPAVGATLMYASVVLSRPLFAPEIDGFALLGILITTGVGTFTLFVVLFHRDGLREVQRLLHTNAGGPAASPSGSVT